MLFLEGVCCSVVEAALVGAWVVEPRVEEPRVVLPTVVEGCPVDVEMPVDPTDVERHVVEEPSARTARIYIHSRI